jgi:peptidoglycan biosynthesis protein MviN/MurJ (putative lipid II flippase)
MAEFMTSLFRQLLRSRLALVCVGFLGLLSGAASITLLVVVLQRAVGSSPSPTWYSYAGVVVQTLAVVTPALACVVIATRGWTQGSDLLRDTSPLKRGSATRLSKPGEPETAC